MLVAALAVSVGVPLSAHVRTMRAPGRGKRGSRDTSACTLEVIQAVAGVCLLQSCWQRTLAVLNQRQRVQPSKASAECQLRRREWRRVFNSTSQLVSG